MEASEAGDCLFSLHLKNCTKTTTALRSPLQKPQLAEVRGGDFLSNFQPHTFEYPKNLVKRTFLSFHTHHLSTVHHHENNACNRRNRPGTTDFFSNLSHFRSPSSSRSQNQSKWPRKLSESYHTPQPHPPLVCPFPSGPY